MRLNPDLTQTRNKARPIFEELRRQILAGRFKTGEKLPGSRSLALTLGVARGTVNLALAMLAAEALVTISPGHEARVLYAPAPQSRKSPARRVELSAWAKRLPTAKPTSRSPFFATGVLADDFFPEGEWRHAEKESRRFTQILQSTIIQSPEGYLPLRQSIAAHLRYSRGIEARAENVVIVNGSMQAIALIAQILLQRGKSAAFENPGFHGIRSAVRVTGANGIACAVDNEGIVLPKKICKLLFVTPASQFPTGIVMSLTRRRALLDYALRQNAYIVEDEYDSEFTRHSNAPQPLKLIDLDGRVIYVGSFSRTMFASLRLGYCLLPDSLLEIFLQARQLYDSVPPALADQTTMATFMLAGAYRRHLRRMAKIYSERHDLLLAGLREHLGDFFEFRPSAAGLSIFGRGLNSQNEHERLTRQFEEAGIGWQNIARYHDGKALPGAIFGFSHLSPEVIKTALQKIATISP